MHDANYLDVLLTWLSGKGGTFRFQDGDYFAEQVRRDPWLETVMDRIVAAIKHDKMSGYGKPYDKSYAGFKGHLQGAKDAVLGFALRDMEMTELGSYHVAWNVTSIDSNGKAKVSIRITDELSNSSVAHYVPGGYSSDPMKSLHHRELTWALNKINPVLNVGVEINITQTVQTR